MGVRGALKGDGEEFWEWKRRVGASLRKTAAGVGVGGSGGCLQTLLSGIRGTKYEKSREEHLGKSENMSKLPEFFFFFNDFIYLSF